VGLSVVEGVFCGLFRACERTNDVGRAEQWLRAADDYVRRLISPKTVEHHVGRILAKLGLPSRARAVAYAVVSSDRAFGP
jgi:hypothetical protein